VEGSSWNIDDSGPSQKGLKIFRRITIEQNTCIESAYLEITRSLNNKVAMVADVLGQKRIAPTFSFFGKCARIGHGN
jgi:hypothetical protein